MIGQVFKLGSEGLREAIIERVSDALRRAPIGVIIQIFLPRRTNEQNAKMWAMLGDISRAQPQGRNLRPDHWKCLFLDDLGHKPIWEPGLEGEGVVNVGYKSSRLTKLQMSDMIERMYEFGDRHEVAWSEPASVDGRPQGGDGEAAPSTTSAVPAQQEDALTPSDQEDIPHD